MSRILIDFAFTFEIDHNFPVADSGSR